MKTKTINGLAFSISQPYAEGHVVTEAEARALNQTRSENIGNNLRAKIKELQDTVADPADLQAQAEALVADLDGTYVFTLAGVGGSAKLDPYEREAQKIAKELIKAHLASAGRKLTDVPAGSTEDEWKDKLAGEIERIAASENVVKAAKKAVDAKRKQGEQLLESIGGLDV